MNKAVFTTFGHVLIPENRRKGFDNFEVMKLPKR